MERNNQLNVITQSLIERDPQNITKTIALFSAAVAAILATASRGEAGEHELQLQLAQSDSPLVTLAAIAFAAGMAYFVIRDLSAAHKKHEEQMAEYKANRDKLMSLPNTAYVKYQICYDDPEYLDCYPSGETTAVALKEMLLSYERNYYNVHLMSLEVQR